MNLKIASFNVNSINMRINTVIDWLNSSKTDILLMQETKCIDENFPEEIFKKHGYYIIFNGQKSYNGVAIASKYPINVIKTELPQLTNYFVEDEQSRFLHVKILGINLICIYLPNGNPSPGPKYDYKINWMKRLYEYSKITYNKNEPLIIGGDYNVIQNKFDCYDITEWVNDALYMEDSRKILKKILNIGFLDSFRINNPFSQTYSFWDYQAGSWQKNNGIRIDLLLISPEIVDALIDNGIDKSIRGNNKPSDHTPVWIEIEKN